MTDSKPQELLSFRKGRWKGFSRSQRGEQTDWIDAVIVPYDGIHLFGTGVSVWRGRRIEFELYGTFDEDNGRINLRKAHLGEFTNIVEYEGEYVLTVPRRAH